MIQVTYKKFLTHFTKRSLLLKKRIRQAQCLFVAFSFSFLFSGCVPENQNITISYPTGEKAPFYAKQNIYPVVGSDYFICNNKNSNVTYPVTTLNILSKDHEIIYEYDDYEFNPVERSEMASDGSIWVSCEKWMNRAPLGRYTNGFLMNTQLFQIDTATGEILFQKETSNGDLYLTTRESRCYFYSQGKEAKKILFFTTVPAQNANIYYRDISAWDDEINIHTFDFSIKPDKPDEETQDVNTLEFALQDDKIVFAVMGRTPAVGEKTDVNPLISSEEISLTP